VVNGKQRRKEKQRERERERDGGCGGRWLCLKLSWLFQICRGGYKNK